MRGGVVLDLFLSSLPAFPYFSPPLPVLHDASAKVCFIAVTIGQKKRFFTIYTPLSRVRAREEGVCVEKLMIWRECFSSENKNSPTGGGGVE